MLYALKIEKVAFLREGEIFSRKSLNWYKSQEFYAYFKVQTRFIDKILPKIIKAKIWQLKKPGFLDHFATGLIYICQICMKSLIFAYPVWAI